MNVIGQNRYGSIEEPLHVRQEAGRHGWHRDGDGWIARRSRADDAPIPGDAPHFGFRYDGWVFVRTCQQALDYDRGVITPPGG